MIDRSTNAPPATALDVRVRLVHALRLDLVGPGEGHALAEERLPVATKPSNWYLTGFLIPSGAPAEQATAEDADGDNDVAASGSLSEESTEERTAAKKTYLPSSMGLSFLVPAAARSLDITVTWGDYEPVEVARGEAKPLTAWQRHPRRADVRAPLESSEGNQRLDVPESGGLRLLVVARAIGDGAVGGMLPPGTRSVSVFLVNDRPTHDTQHDIAYAFQAAVAVRADAPFVPRPDPQGAAANTWDDEVADLHYADTPEFATGHGVSAEWDVTDGECHRIATTWIPDAQVEKTDAAEVASVELGMDALGELTDADAVRAALQPLVDAYRTWIAGQERAAKALEGRRCETAAELVRGARHAADRIQRGIDLLARDPDALDAFRVANRAVAKALRKRLHIESPRWRPFQLAFMLVNLPGLADPADPSRETVDLLFFPTGGGKTEAYLGLAAFAMVLRRLRHPADDGRAGAGVCVLMRYTLRLLTLDQLGRAAGLVCALELERAQAPERYGTWPFEIGLWVGKAATPNRMGRKGDKSPDGTARDKVRKFKANPDRNPPPIPLERCPWCGTPFSPDSFSLMPDADAPRELRVVCVDFACDFTRDRPLPIVGVDEPLYRRLPAFIVATVDKFATLPWVGPSGALLGGADRRDADGFYGPAEPKRGTPLSAPLPPPDLVIQDELHLISGPLGTMAGLYETAIEALATRREGERVVRPKIVASTATVRRAQDQIQALFGRGVTQVFPPPGMDRRDTFFAHTVTADEKPARLYLGIAAPGRNPKAVMRRTILPLMAAAQRAYEDAGGIRHPDNPADAYMTLLGYFNSLRELGGARRILEEEVQNTLRGYGERRRDGEEPGMFADRTSFTEVLELTSRVPTDKVAEARGRLGQPFSTKEHVDCAIATNMISVGLDIPRLGLMVVLGQPKTHSEYIQATSRVGRDDARPGLVVTLLNVHKPRDRSHYERFRHYHESFYRAVEVASVTPFAARAMDRGFAGALVALARHGVPALAPARGAEQLSAVRAEAERRVLEAFLERVRSQQMDPAELAACEQAVQARVGDLLDAWRAVVDDYAGAGVAVQYQQHEADGPKPLLRDLLDANVETASQRKFRVNRSLRDVEPTVNLFLHYLSGADVEVDR